MHVDSHDPQHTPTEQQMDDRRDVVQDHVPAPVPIAIGVHHRVLRVNIQDAITFTLHWLSVAKVVLKILTSPITIALASFLLVTVATYTSSFVVSGIIRPLCSMPLLSVVPICNNFSQPRPEMQELPFTKLMEAQQGLLPVLEAAGSSTSLALDFKRVEMKISDLNTLVQLSDLDDKDEISSFLYEFEASAEAASEHLSCMESNIEGAGHRKNYESLSQRTPRLTEVARYVDSEFHAGMPWQALELDGQSEWEWPASRRFCDGLALVTDYYVIQTLERIEHSEQQQQKSVISAIISPFVPYPSSRPKIVQAFNHMADSMQSELEELVESAMAAKIALTKLRLNMKDIFNHVSKAQGQTKSDLERTLADLWTIVGGNRAKLARFAGHHALLSQIGNYHSTAVSKVSQALVELRKLEHNLKRLRTRVATPLLPNDPVIPLEDHIENLRKGVEVLTEGKFRAKGKENQVIEQIRNRRKYPILGFT